MSRSDRLLKIISRTAAGLVATVVLLIVAFVAQGAWPALHRIGPTRFLTDAGWHPSSDAFNLLPMAAASVVTSVGAVLLAAPLGVASAALTTFYAPAPLASCHRRLVELLAGIPSVVFGLWGLVVLAPIVAGIGGSGQNLLTATLVLALMILPTVALVADSSLRSVPAEAIAGAAALGLERSAVVWRVAVPAARRGIAAGVILAFTRALGETMAVLMLAGNVVQMPTSLTTPVRTLNANIALELGYASAAHRSVLFVSGLLSLLLVTALVVAAARYGEPTDA